MNDEEKINELGHACEILLSQACSQIYPGRIEYDVMQPIEISINLIKSFLMKLYPQKREQVLDSVIVSLMKMKMNGA